MNVRIDTEVGERVPFIDADVERSAKEMGHAYPYFYLFENSVRGLVVSRMDAAFSGGWWDESHIAKEIVRDAAARMTKEKRHRWHATRGGHPIYYTDFDNLRSIISRHWTSVFEPDLGDVTIVQAMFTEMEELRNIVAHNNPLEAHDLERLQSNFRTWVRQLRAVANPRAAMAPSTK